MKNKIENCILYNSKDLYDKLYNSGYAGWIFHSYMKIKNDKDLDSYDKQKESKNYFKKVNMYGYQPSKKINSYNVSNETECMDKCIEEESCESIVFSEPKNSVFSEPKNSVFSEPKNSVFSEPKNSVFSEPKNSVFSEPKNSVFSEPKNSVFSEPKNSVFSEPKNTKEDSKEIQKKEKSSTLNVENVFMKNVNQTEKDIKKLKNRKYTDCIRNDYNDYPSFKKRINMECKRKYGDEYLFVNDSSVLDSLFDSVVDPELNSDCKENSEKVECVMNLNKNMSIEFFDNETHIEISNTTYILILCIILFIFFIFYILIFFIQ